MSATKATGDAKEMTVATMKPEMGDYPWEEADPAATAEDTETPREVAVIPAPAQPVTDHVIVGLGMLAKMSEAEFEEKLEVLRRGRERVALIQRNLMVEGQDYGKVKGIDRPFLHLPGAEQLEKFYGFVAEQRTERLLGDGVNQPPYAYRTDTYVHLGDLAGPVVGFASATCNPWEERYRYRWEKPKCPECNREGLVRGRKDGKLAGKWWCPGREGGCNRTFEPNDERIGASRKVENTDLWSLDETIIQMSQKRSYVAGIRRATGTSGLFTIDEDSPSVRAQAEDASSESDEPPATTKAEPRQVERGGRTETATPAQIRRVQTLSHERDLGPERIAQVLERVAGQTVEFPEDAGRAARGKALLGVLSGMKADDLGRVIAALETGEVAAA